ncbi:hypothetical protein A5708_19275 [Mycobacterium colombiense]|uniref:Uncharacterized protein n=1 Tax=Mycobacterium colombiense TaxID=339268 RepID=A0A1A2Z019_9MYCO|nr:hypothetical protein A5708_19275 [Mycobacterium colombiense]
MKTRSTLAASVTLLSTSASFIATTSSRVTREKMSPADQSKSLSRLLIGRILALAVICRVLRLLDIEGHLKVRAEKSMDVEQFKIDLEQSRA